ncbi:MAG: Rossmann-like and DUF2520 domain-containing protein [Chitinophagaceae bacterium]
MNISIIGTGKVATILAQKLFAASHKIVCIVGRNKSATQILANQCNALALNMVEEIPSETDLILIAVSDDGIKEIANKLSVLNTIVVHTAGAISKDLLKGCSENYGILYPLQSITVHTKSTVDIPFIIDGNNDFTINELTKLASTISSSVVFGNDEYRSRLHVAAVLVNNFTNYLYALAEDFCAKENVDFKLLQPIIRETANRLQYQSPKNVFTGPAIRNDAITIKKHLEILEQHTKLKPLYSILSNSLQEYYQNLSSQ